MFLLESQLELLRSHRNTIVFSFANFLNPEAASLLQNADVPGLSIGLAWSISWQWNLTRRKWSIFTLAQ
jgi:hypothetical protein